MTSNFHIYLFLLQNQISSFSCPFWRPFLYVSNDPLCHLLRRSAPLPPPFSRHGRTHALSSRYIYRGSGHGASASQDERDTRAAPPMDAIFSLAAGPRARVLERAATRIPGCLYICLWAPVIDGQLIPSRYVRAPSPAMAFHPLIELFNLARPTTTCVFEWAAICAAWMRGSAAAAAAAPGKCSTRTGARSAPP